MRGGGVAGPLRPIMVNSVSDVRHAATGSTTAFVADARVLERAVGRPMRMMVTDDGNMGNFNAPLASAPVHWITYIHIWAGMSGHHDINCMPFYHLYIWWPR